MHVLDKTSHKQGYALHQLLETSRSQEELRCFLESLSEAPSSFFYTV